MKTLTTDRDRTPKPDAVSSLVPQTWDDYCRVYAIYEALARQCGLPGGPYPSGTKSGSWSEKKIRDRDLLWLDRVDAQVQAVHLRHSLVATAVAREDGLRLLLQRHLCKSERQASDRDKIDLLVVQYFVLCAPQDLIAGSMNPSDVARILRPVLGEVPPTSLECCEPLDRILEAAQQCSRLREFMEQGLMEQGRLVKEAVGDMFYDPAALVSICRFNFLFRRSFIQWLHADLRAIGAALNQLDKQGIKVVDCRNAGFSATEPISKLREFHQHWKPPFQTDYSKDSAFRPYEQLMCFREDLEDALGMSAAPTGSTLSETMVSRRDDGAKLKSQLANTSTERLVPAAPSPASSVPPPAGKPRDVAVPARQRVAQSNSALAEAAPSPDQKLPNIGVADVENLEEKIWEQLIATPPVRGRSMTTVTVENTRILLSAWEVAAFISDSGQDSEKLRRLIGARAMLSTAIDRRRRLMDFKMLHQAIAHARGEIPRFQERIDQLKRTMKTDGAVNLGISLKRLLSLVEEADQLQKGNEPQK